MTNKNRLSLERLLYQGDLGLIIKESDDTFVVLGEEEIVELYTRLPEIFPELFKGESNKIHRDGHVGYVEECVQCGGRGTVPDYDMVGYFGEHPCVCTKR